MCGGCGWGRLVSSMCFATMVVPVCVVLCVSFEAVVADRIGMAALRLLDAAAACVIRSSFAAEDC